MSIYLGNHLVDISSEEYIDLSDEEREKILKEGYARKSMAVKFLVERRGMARSTAYKWFKSLFLYDRYVPLKSFLRTDRDCYEYLLFTEMKKRKDYITLKEAAERLGISYRHAKRLVKEGKILAIKRGKAYDVLNVPQKVSIRQNRGQTADVP